jgi:hypothetical protein
VRGGLAIGLRLRRVVGLFVVALGCHRAPQQQPTGSIQEQHAKSPEGVAVAVSPQPAPVAPRPACEHDPVAESAVAAELVHRIEVTRSNPKARVSVTFRCPTDSVVGTATGIDGLRANGHGGYLFLVGATFDASGAGEVRGVRFKPQSSPTLDGPGPSLEIARAPVTVEAARKTWAIIRAALAAEVHVDVPVPVVGETQSVTAHMTTHDTAIALRILSASAVTTSREWHGYLNNLDEPILAPLDLAWHAVFQLLPTSFTPGAAEGEDKQLFLRSWQTKEPRPDWVTEEQLGLASLLGTREILASLMPELESSLPRRRVLAVNALAALTGDDLRRGADGKVRPLPVVVADYRKQWAPADAGR